MKKHLTLLNVIACFAVVALHTNGVVHQFSYDRYWISSNIIENIFYFAVPIFFMITGITSIDYRKKYTTKEFLKKRFIKTFIPFIVWSFIGLMYHISINGVSGLTFREIFNGFILTKYIGLFWFCIPLFAVYLSMPLLSAVPEKLRKEVYGYIIVTAFIFNALLPLIFNLLNLKYNYDFIIPVSSGYVIYVLLGYYLENYMTNKTYYKFIYVCGLLAVIIQIIGTQYFSYQIGNISIIFKGYLGVTTLIYSSAIYLAVKQIAQSNFFDKVYFMMSVVAKRTFGIYLIQYFILEITYRSGLNLYSLSYRIIAPFIVFIICYSIVYVLQKIPMIKHIIP